MSIDELVIELEDIASRNDNEFTYNISLELRGNKLRFTFECAETSDESMFVSGVGETLQEAVDSAVMDIESALDKWGYE